MNPSCFAACRARSPEALIDELRGRASNTPRRRYQAEEVDEIIKRASELEASNPTQSGAMTIGGVEAIAAEVGIAPGLVRSAAASVAPSETAATVSLIEPPKRNAFIGGATRILVQRLVPGELRESDFPRLVDEIRRAFQNVGYVSQLGRSMTWSMSRGSAGRHDVDVAIIVGDGSTRVVVEEGLAQMVGGIFGGLGGGLGGGGTGLVVATVMALHAAPALPIVLPLWYVGVLALARTSFQRLSRRRERELETTADRLATTAAHLIQDRTV